MRTLTLMVTVIVVAGCAGASRALAPVVPQPSAQVHVAPPPCSDCDSVPMPREVAQAIEERIADLDARGGDCRTYGTVLEQTYRSGRITVRPYMWRVSGHLTSGEAQQDGEIAMAQEIDTLNVGVRTLSEMIWTVEHEAVHLAFHIASHTSDDEAQVNGHVRACRRES